MAILSISPFPKLLLALFRSQPSKSQSVFNKAPPPSSQQKALWESFDSHIDNVYALHAEFRYHVAAVEAGADLANVDLPASISKPSHPTLPSVSILSFSYSVSYAEVILQHNYDLSKRVTFVEFLEETKSF